MQEINVSEAHTTTTIIKRTITTAIKLSKKRVP
jgi:hypothetical protein